MSGSPGYSLVEMLIALAIMALIVLVAVPATSSTIDRMTLSADARTLTTGLRALRAVALDRQTDITLTSTGRGLSASHGSGIELSAGTAVDVVQVGRDRRFVLRWDGTANGAITLTRGSSELRVVVDRLTGRLSVETVR